MNKQATPFMLTVYHSGECANAKNCRYPNVGAGSTPEELKQLFCYDHTFIRFKNNYRSIDNFEEVAVAVLDNDNDHSDDPSKWISVEDIPRLFPDVPCIVYTSRNHMRQKGNRSPRPRFHAAFPVAPITDSSKFTSLMQRIQAAYPFFDDNALDAGRFFFGNPDTEVYIFPGSAAIDRFLDEQAAEDAFAEMERTIPEGSRNSTLSHAAGKILKRWGDTKEAGRKFLEEAEKCSPPLDRGELQQIWHILHNLIQCNAKRRSVAFVKQPIYVHIILRFLSEYVAICFDYYDLSFFRLTFTMYSCILLLQVNIPFKCLWMR